MKNCISHIPRRKREEKRQICRLCSLFHRTRTFISTFLVVVARYIFTDPPVIQTLVHCDVWYVFISWTQEYIETLYCYFKLSLTGCPNVNRTNKLFKLCKNFRNKNFFERTRVSIQRSVHRGDSTPDKSRSCFGHLRLLNRCWSKIAEARVALDSTFSTVPRDIHI